MIHKPEIHEKSWGAEHWLDNCELYCGKILVFNAGGSTSMHYHVKKQETMYLRKGKMLVRFENETIPLAIGDCLRIEREQKHQLIAVEDSELIEISTQHFESDSVREPFTAATSNTSAHQ